MLYRRCPRTPGPGIWKRHLDQNHVKLIMKYRHTNVNQHVLAEKVPKNTNKNQIASLRSQLSNHVQSVALPRYKNQWGRAWRRSSLISAFLKVWIQSSAEIFVQQKSGRQFVLWSSAENQTTLKSAKIVCTPAGPIGGGAGSAGSMGAPSGLRRRQHQVVPMANHYCLWAKYTARWGNDNGTYILIWLPRQHTKGFRGCKMHAQEDFETFKKTWNGRAIKMCIERAGLDVQREANEPNSSAAAIKGNTTKGLHSSVGPHHLCAEAGSSWCLDFQDRHTLWDWFCNGFIINLSSFYPNHVTIPISSKYYEI